MSTPAKDNGALTARDMEILLAAFQCAKTEFTVDYVKLAEKLGLKNAGSSKASWNGLKKKLGLNSTGLAIPDNTETPSKKRKTTEDDEVEKDEEDEGNSSPQKTPVKKGRGKKVKKEEVEDSAAEE